MSSETPRSRWLLVAGRIGASAVSLGVVAGAILVSAAGIPQSVIRSLPGGSEELVVRDVVVSPPDRVRVCNGPILGFLPQVTEARGFGQPTEQVVGEDVTAIDISSPELFNGQGLQGGDPATPLTAYRQPATASGLAGVTFQTSDTTTLRGLATAACLPPQYDTWIPAGSTVTGRQAVLSLTNPGNVTAVVDVTVYGQTGAIQAPSAKGILLPPGSRRVFPLSGFAPDEPSPVVRVVSSGSPVAAALHATVTRGLEADGVAIATGGGSPSNSVVIPAVLIEGDDPALEARQQEGYADLAPALRLLSPEADTTATIVIVRPGQSDVVSEATLSAGRVTDVNLDLLGSGIFSILIEADDPIVAGARVSVVGEGRTDVSWVSAQPVITDTTILVLPFGPNATLSFVAIEGDVEVTLSRLSPNGSVTGAQTTLRVTEGDATNRTIGVAGGGYLIETSGPVVVAGVITLDAGVGHIAVAPTPPDTPPVRVIVR